MDVCTTAYCISVAIFHDVFVIFALSFLIGLIGVTVLRLSGE